jgi:hypothetical protein
MLRMMIIAVDFDLNIVIVRMMMMMMIAVDLDLYICNSADHVDCFGGLNCNTKLT